jgi:hypothetical protein
MVVELFMNFKSMTKRKTKSLCIKRNFWGGLLNYLQPPRPLASRHPSFFKEGADLSKLIYFIHYLNPSFSLPCKGFN